MPEIVVKIIEQILPMLIALATQVIDSLLAGEKLSADQLKAVKSALALAEIWGPEYVASTANTMDDEGLQAFITLCKDTLQEGE